MSSYVKAEGTTSRLLAASSEILRPHSTEYLTIVDLIEKEHVKALHEAIPNTTTNLSTDTSTEANLALLNIRLEAERDVRLECDRLKSFMSAAEIIDEISPRSRDVIVSVGEKLSARIFTAVLQSKGLDAKYINLDKLVDPQKFNSNANNNGGKSCIDQSFYDYLADRLRTILTEAGCQEGTNNSSPTCIINNNSSSSSSSVIPVVTGFFGPVPGSMLSTIGRGYTDLTAALIAVGMKANELQIWKEVDGIFTADPRKVPRACLLRSISPEEAAELTYYGSEVIHPFTMEQVIKAQIPIRIKNTFKPAGSGTVILPEGWTEDDIYKSPLLLASSINTNNNSNNSTVAKSANGHLRRLSSFSSKHPTAVTIKDNVSVVNIHSNRKSHSHGFFAHIFMTLDKYGIIVDLISTSEVHISMALNPSVTADQLTPALAELAQYGHVDTLSHMAILSLVGKEMRNMVGIASKMFMTLAGAGVNIEMISQGASEINISCVIDERKGDVALRAIHDECIMTGATTAASTGGGGGGGGVGAGDNTAAGDEFVLDAAAAGSVPS